MYTIHNDDLGRDLEFASEAAYEKATDWVDGVDKELIVDFCGRNGVDLLEATDDLYFRSGRKLVEGWAGIAAELHARVKELA